MIDHVSIPVSSLEKSTSFYEHVLEHIGLTLLVTRAHTVGFGKKYPEFWLNLRADIKPIDQSTGHHVCLRAPTREAVIAFHETALRLGGTDAGAPKDRDASVTRYFGAFIFDADGNKIEAVTFPRPDGD